MTTLEALEKWATERKGRWAGKIDFQNNCRSSDGFRHNPDDLIWVG